MRIHIPPGIFSIITLLFFLAVPRLAGQKYAFENYDASRNIPDGVVYTLNQSDDGFIWLGTGKGLSRFDGHEFFNVPFPDSRMVTFPTASLKDAEGRLWFGCDNGLVCYTDNNKLVNVYLRDSLRISEITQDPDGRILVVPRSGAVYSVTINRQKPEIKRYGFSSSGALLSAALRSDGKLLVGSEGKIMVCTLGEDTVKVESVIEEFDYSNITRIHKEAAGEDFIVGTADAGLFRLSSSAGRNIVSRYEGIPELGDVEIKAITEDKGHSLWIATKDAGVFQLTMSGDYSTIRTVRIYNSTTDLQSNNVLSVLQDLQGNIWFGFNGNGLSILRSYAFSHYLSELKPVPKNIIYVNSLRDKIFLGTPSGFHLFDPDKGVSESFTDLSGKLGKTGPGSAAVLSYYLDRDDNLWIGTDGNGLFLRNKSGTVTSFFRTGDSGSDAIKDIDIDSSRIWLSTTNGVIVLDRKTREELMTFTMNNGLPHNSINRIFLARNGNAYVATKTNKLYWIDRDLNIVSGQVLLSGSTEITSFAQSSDGAIWAATSGAGVFKCINDSVYSLATSEDFNRYCYSVFNDSDNNLWIGHDMGFSRYDLTNGTLRYFGSEYALNGICNPGAIYESSGKMLFIGTTDGLIVYNRMNDSKIKTAPRNNITYITIGDSTYVYQSSFTLPYRKNYPVRIGYTGIDFSAPDKVMYSTYMENYDAGWSRMSASREATYNLRDGSYRFNLLSVNDDGVSQETALTFDITIKGPFWRTWWFILLVSSVVIGALVLIIVIRDRAQRRIQEYLEKELEARTRVIMKQKTEIELQNIEITDSINYAKRIQSSILPDIKRLKDTFRDAFILFQPRDIVSGDFYWFEKIDEDTIIVVCADSTGHGVPGAFMSMIGSTLLQDIVGRQRVSQPSQVLSQLDKRVFSTLNQNLELGVSNDGMDLVVCEINVRTRRMRFASAMRPIILMIDGELFYIRGNRLSVGGESVFEKYFDDQEYVLNEGDSIYFFSDGLPDQFGGSDGKKLKIARLKRLIEHISRLPMDDQKEEILKFYHEWKGSYNQVDDIIFMGLKV